MHIKTIKTRLVHAGEITIEALLAESLPTAIDERSVIAISSKVIALCQNRVVPKENTTKDELIRREADFYTPDGFNKYGFNFTILNKTFIPAAGIDESNANGQFVLWPTDPQKVANTLRTFLSQHFGVKHIGVIITDSTSMPPMRGGTIGIMLAHSGFVALKRLVGTTDLFDREFKVARSAIGSGLAAAANVVMGEGAEQTPIAVITDIPFVQFQQHNPTDMELQDAYIAPKDDIYAPFIFSVPWEKGGGQSK